MNINDNILEAKLFLPDGREFKGRLIFAEQQHNVEFSENPNGRMSPKPIPVVFCEADNKKYTLVHCILSRSNFKKSSYIINELYQGEYLKTGLEENYIGLAATFSYLTDWLKADVFELATLDTKDFYFSTKVRPNKEYKIRYGENKILIFEGGSEVKMERNEIIISKKSSLTITSENPVCRQELFQNYFSFLNLYSLFLRKLPQTYSLSFKRESSDLKLLLHSIENKKDSAFVVLLGFDKLTIFEQIIAKYFKFSLEFDQIIPLWEAGMKERLDPEIVFLHLTQSIELFHKCFFEKDSSIEEIANEIVSDFNFRYKKPSKNWIQIMRYYHLYKVTVKIGLKVPFSKEKTDFILHLLDSRNFYTHHDEKQFVWTHFELYAINNILRVWMRGLLLNQLELPISNIQNCINGDFYTSIDIDIFNNLYSMRYVHPNKPNNPASYASL